MDDLRRVLDLNFKSYNIQSKCAYPLRYSLKYQTIWEGIMTKDRPNGWKQTKAVQVEVIKEEETRGKTYFKTFVRSQFCRKYTNMDLAFHPVVHNAEDKAIGDLTMNLAKSFARLQQATAWIAENGLKDPMQAGAASADYLKMFGLVALGFMWCRMAKVSAGKLADGAGDKAFHDGKLKLAHYYMAKVLPDTSSLLSKITAGADPVMAFAEEAF